MNSAEQATPTLARISMISVVIFTVSVRDALIRCATLRAIGAASTRGRTTRNSSPPRAISMTSEVDAVPSRDRATATFARTESTMTPLSAIGQKLLKRSDLRERYAADSSRWAQGGVLWGLRAYSTSLMAGAWPTITRFPYSHSGLLADTGSALPHIGANLIKSTTTTRVNRSPLTRFLIVDVVTRNLRPSQPMESDSGHVDRREYASERDP